MWSSLFEALSKISLSRGARDDDSIDQLHHMGTVTLFALFAALIGMNQYVGDPIHCWVPAQFPTHHTQFAENLCWISQMYYIPMNEEVPKLRTERMKNDISFYRWVVAVFLIQCFFFKFPNMLWKELRTYSGINVQKIVNMADEVVMTSQENRDEKINDICYFLHKWLKSYRVYKYNVMVRFKEKMSSIFCFAFGKRQGTYLTGLFLFIKFLNLINVICQFVMLTAFLKFNYWTYGFDVLKNLSGRWMDVDHFPRIVMCDFEIRQVQNVQNYSLQCVLSINLFIEKIFAVAWFWLFFLGVASLLNLAVWVYETLCSKRQQHFIEKYLIILEDEELPKERELFKSFVRDYLRDDGVFLLRSVGNNSSEIILMDLIKVLWSNFREATRERMKKIDGKLNFIQETEVKP